jgi:4-aminobutyrate aminotransferase / (S)-3-amino-2-methylpropionate transaminase / 5-aminovalerate transaminase
LPGPYDGITTRDEWGSATRSIIDCLAAHEPAALHTQLPVVWTSARGARVRGEDGREWLDWTSGILTANLGHAPEPVIDAIIEELRAPLLHSYGFATRIRAQTVERLTRLCGMPFVVLTATGTEAVEVAIKLCRSRARLLGRNQAVVISFVGAFHGRTAGAQLAGGLAAQKHWTPAAAGEFIQLPYPGAPGSRFEIEGVRPSDVACIILEPYQGSTMRAIASDAAGQIGAWCREYDVPLVIDEIQSGFGRTGSLFAHERLGITPDLLLVGKGLASGQPVAGVLYRDPQLTAGIRAGELTTTHGGNPIALAAANATIEMFMHEGVLDGVPSIASALSALLTALKARWPDRIGFSACYGAIAGFEVVRADGVPDPEVARRFVVGCARRGLLLLAPVGPNGNLLKFAPPLIAGSFDLSDAVAIAYGVADDELD